VVYGEPQQPTSSATRCTWPEINWDIWFAERCAEAARAPIVLPPDVSDSHKLAVEALVRQGITFGWTFGLTGLDLPKVDITWDGDEPSFKARG